MSKSRNARICHYLPLMALVLGLFFPLVGCEKAKKETSTAVAQPLAGVKLSLTVIDDPAMAEAISRLRGEWTAQTGSEFEVRQVTEGQLAADSLGDALIGPPRLLGSLATKEWVRPLPDEKRLRKENFGNWSDIFELLTVREATWNGNLYGVPLGSPVLVCYYRADLLKHLNRRPPKSWAEYQALAELLADRKNLGDAAPPEGSRWAGALEPLAPGWAGLTLMARAAPYVKHRSNYATFFDIHTMEPTIDSPAFVRAMDELAAAAKLGAKEPLGMTPEGVLLDFWRGKCGMALTWPPAAKRTIKTDGPVEPGDVPSAKDDGARPEKSSSTDVQVAFVELPGSAKAFDLSTRRWSSRTEDESPHVPLLGIAGRMGFVSAKSPHPDGSMQLLLWLSGEAVSTQVATVSPATTLFRKSHLKTPKAWVEPRVPPTDAARYAALTEQTLGRQQSVMALRIPGQAEYLAALDAAVGRVIRGEQSSMDSLHRAAKEWQEITQKLGVEQQKTAYLRCLGIE